jgi:hypothetical protein
VQPGRQFADPDQRLRRWGWLAFAAWTAVGGVQLVQAWRAGEDAIVGVALSAPLWAAWLLWLLWRGASALKEAARQRALRRWHGNFYEFRGRQIRIVFDGDEVLVAGDDVFDALGIDRRGRAPDRVRLLAGRDGLVELAAGRLLVFTERGLRAWLERRTDATAVKFGRWFEAEVAVPHRRRRARDAG